MNPQDFTEFAGKARALYARGRERTLSISIRYKIAAALIAILCAAIASLGAVSFSLQKRTLQEETRLRAEIVARQLAVAARTALLTREELPVVSAIRELQRSSDVRYAVVLDRRGYVFAHSNRALRGTRPTADADLQALGSLTPGFQTLQDDADPVLESYVPIEAHLGKRALRVGTARVGLSLRPLEQAIGRQKTAFLLMTTGFVFLGLLISFALARVLTRRIIVLMSSMKEVGRGELHELACVDPRDEIGALAQSFNDMILHLREKLKMEKYLSRSTLQLIKKLRDADRLELGGERRHVAVLFSDIRGFTALTESLDPEQVVSLLNIYLNMQAEVVHARGGVVDKFVGDEVMAIFTDEDCEFRAALAAQEILNFTRSLNEARERAGQRTMWLGIGLNAGSVIMANVGSERQMDYTVIGDPINTAARLCKAAVTGQAVMSRSIADAVGERCRRSPLPPVALKGKQNPVEAWELLDLPGAARRYMRRPLTTGGSCRLLGLDEGYAIRVLDVGRGGCSVVCPVPLTPGSRLAVSFAVEGLGVDGMAAVVRSVAKEPEGYRAGLAFEDAAPEKFDAITAWVHRVDTQIAAPA